MHRQRPWLLLVIGLLLVAAPWTPLARVPLFEGLRADVPLTAVCGVITVMLAVAMFWNRRHTERKVESLLSAPDIKKSP